MINNKRIVIDLDGTITIDSDLDYEYAKPNYEVIEKLKKYKKEGFEIVIFSARNMRTFEGNIGLINIHTLPIILDWLRRHEVPFNEVVLGKPWCGTDGLYVDDRAIRPSEFIRLNHSEILKLISS